MRSYRKLKDQRNHLIPRENILTQHDWNTLMKYMSTVLEVNDHLSSLLITEQEKRGQFKRAMDEGFLKENMRSGELVTYISDLQRQADTWKEKALVLEEALTKPRNSRFFQMIRTCVVSIQKEPKPHRSVCVTKKVILSRIPQCVMCRRH